MCMLYTHIHSTIVLGGNDKFVSQCTFPSGTSPYPCCQCLLCPSTPCLEHCMMSSGLQHATQKINYCLLL